jgi:hypothetical protein
MTEDKLNELIQELAEYILANSQKDLRLGIERDYALLLAQEIGSRIYQEVLAEWKKKHNGEKTNGKEKEKEAV